MFPVPWASLSLVVTELRIYLDKDLASCMQPTQMCIRLLRILKLPHTVAHNPHISGSQHVDYALPVL